MKRFLLFVMMCVCVSIGTWADVSIREGSTADEVIVEVTGDSYGQFASHNFTDAEKALLDRAKLTLVGKFNESDLQKFRDIGKNNATTVNFWDAEFAPKTVYTGDVPKEVSSQTFEYWNSVTSIIMSDKETLPLDRQSLMGNTKNTITTAKIAGAIDVPDEMFVNSEKLTSVTFSSKVKSIGKQAFKCPNLATLDFGTDSHITYIGVEAFQGAGQLVKDENGDVYPFPHNKDGVLTIPNTVKKIDQYAFNNVPIKTIVINKESQLESIENYAFFYDSKDRKIAPLNDIYVYADKEIECAFEAFSPMHTDGQTDIGTVRTRLHYPTNHYDFYVGEWKSQINGGKVQGHDDLLALRKVIDGTGHTIEGETVVCTPKTGIGWQRFVSSGIPVTFDMDWRTYSDIVDRIVPNYADKIADVYIVCGYEGGKAVLKQMKQGDVIPAGTGVVIHHYVTKEGGGMLMFPHLTAQEASIRGLTADDLKPYRFVSDDDKRGAVGASEWNTDEYAFAKGMKYVGIETHDYVSNGQSYHNYLEAIHCMGVERAIYNAENGNYVNYNTLEMQAYSGQKVTYRNFFFGNGEKLQASMNAGSIGKGKDWNATTDGKMGWGFFRCMTDMYAINSKAFLHYPADVFTQSHSASPGTITEGVTASAKTFDNMILLDEDLSSPSSIATGITTMDQETTTRNEGYYTIQGVKVSIPQKNGLYIHNGKKYVVK